MATLWAKARSLICIGNPNSIDRPVSSRTRRRALRTPRSSGARTGPKVTPCLRFMRRRLHNLKGIDVSTAAGSPYRNHGRVRLRQIHPGARRAIRQYAYPPRAQAWDPSVCADWLQGHHLAARHWNAYWKSTRPRSARPPAPARPPTWASGTSIRRFLPEPPKPASAATPPAASRSIRLAGAAAHAMAKA